MKCHNDCRSSYCDEALHDRKEKDEEIERLKKTIESLEGDKIRLQGLVEGLETTISETKANTDDTDVFPRRD